MYHILILNLLAIGEIFLCLVALGCIFWRRQTSNYKYLCFFLGLHATTDLLLIPLLLLGGHGISGRLAYDLYFYVYWPSFAAESILGLLLIRSVFNLAMAPLEGLQRLGAIVFRWVASISTVIALASVLTPHLSQKSIIVRFVMEFQRTQSILILGLLLFVCFAIRPLGLTLSSRIFGTSLGLGILALTNLITSLWGAHFQSMYTALSTVSSVATLCVFLLWSAYFALPEAKRRIIVLPTTSPFLRWNQISLVLGDEPGFVAIGGIPPELFAPAELEMMRRASLQMAEQSSVAL